jgi:hypothetical protein
MAKRLLVLAFLVIGAFSLRAEELVYDWSIPYIGDIIAVADVSPGASGVYLPYFHTQSSSFSSDFEPCDASYSYSCITNLEIFPVSIEGGDPFPGFGQFTECPIECDSPAPFWANFPTLYDITTLGTYSGNVSGSPLQPLTTLTISLAPEPRTRPLELAGLAGICLLLAARRRSNGRPHEKAGVVGLS